MNFTREPIIETVVTPREGCKLVVRNSKGQAQEDYFVDAVEVVSFGSALFFRSLEKPKSFLVPVSDYEVLELRETRMVLKHVPSERSLKIGGGKEQPPRPQRESHPEPRHQEREAAPTAPSVEEADSPQPPQAADGAPADPRAAERKRERRRRGRRGRSERAPDGTTPAVTPTEGSEQADSASEDQKLESGEEGQKPEHSETEAGQKKQPSLLSRIFFAPPPPLMVRARLQPKPVEAEIPPSDVEAPPVIEEMPFDNEEPKSDE